MSDTCETVNVKDDKAPGGYVVINKEDFDEKKHKLWTEPKVEKTESAPPKATK